MLSIIEATEADADIISQLSVDTFYETYAAYNTAEDMEQHSNQYFSRQQILTELAAPETFYLIAYVDNQAAGFVKLRNEEHPPELQGERYIEIERIYVLKAFQKQKLGGAIMRFTLEAAKAKGYEIIWLGVWKNNTNAQGFYQRMGFEIFGEHAFVLGNDRQEDWLLKKQLE